MSSGLSIGPDGYFSRGGERFIPVGVNYWPGSCGFEMWRTWPDQEILRDLDLLVSLGLNSIRFFLRWQDFEPAAGQYDPAIFARLTEFLTWCGERGIFAQPTLFAPHAGEPAWRQGRNFFDDDFMRQRAVDFAFTAGRVASAHHANLLGIDLGHELCRLPDCQSASIESIRTWRRDVASAVRGGYREALIVCGNGIDQITRDTGWRLGNPGGCDFASMHGSTLPQGHPVATDGLTDPFLHSLLPLYTEIARSFGPVLVQDLGTSPTGGARQQEAYLRAVLPACWNAGANGFLWTLFRDIPEAETSGLVDDSGVVKRGLETFLEFAHAAVELPQPRVSANYVGLYLSKHYYPRENPDNAGNHPPDVSRSLATANYHLRHAGNEVHIVRGDRPINARTKTIFVAGSNLRAHEVEALTAWVEAGGRLIWHGPDPLNWGSAYQKLLGAVPVDCRAPHEALVAWAGAEWKIGVFPRDMRIEVQPLTASVLAVDDTGLPVVLRHSFGRGSVTYALPSVEEAIARATHPRADRDRCTKWYQAMLRE